VYRVHGENMNGKLVAMTAGNIRKIIAQHETRIGWLDSIATSLGHEPRAAQWRSGNWRILTLSYLISRISGAGESPTIAENLRPVFRIQGNPMKRAILALVVLCIRLAPVNLALDIASRVIKLRYM
jgi:hypothetical protein